MRSNVLLLLFTTLLCVSGYSQLSDLHYLPPLKQGRNNEGIRQQRIHLSTPETAAFTVNVYQGTNPMPVQNFTISNTAPAVYTLGDGDNNITLVNDTNTGIVLSNSGLRFESTGGQLFYVNYRGRSANQAASLTSKGREALGTNFRWGGVPNLGGHNSKSNTLGIMATEDNTTVTLSGYDPDCRFRQGNNIDGITANSYTITLNANQSFVFENYVGTRNIAAHIDGWIGATLQSDKDIVISNGSINYGRQAGASNRDAGIDQPVPIENTGKEYVFIRGNGNADGRTEFPLIIATADDTDIEIGGTIVATIDNGEYFQVPSTFYSGTTAGANMYIETSKDVYAYQCLAGSTGVQTAGLNFIAPVNCLLPNFMDNIPDIRNMAGIQVTGGLTIIAAVNTPDANVQVFENGVEVTKPASIPVAGSNDWKTFYIPNLSGNVSALSTGPIAAGFLGFDGNRGVAGYFSGFDTVPDIVLDVTSGPIGSCFAGASIVIDNNETFDAYQWFQDGVLIPGANQPFFDATEAGDYFVRITRGPCTFDSNPLAVFFCDPDVVVNKSVADAEITEGETTIFTISVENLGFEPVTNLQITDNIPAGLTLINGVTATGSWNGTVWNIGTLDPGIPVFLELEVRGDEILTEPLLNITNTVTNAQDQTDFNITEDIMSASVIVHNDFDNDGVIDVADLDDDNDGIYDVDECGPNFCFESIINESFENPILSADVQLLDETAVPGWLTTATDGQIELWRSGFQGVDSYDGNQHAELNANNFGALYQNLCLAPGTIMNWSLRHRARGNGADDIMQLRIGADLASAGVEATLATDNTEWVLYSGSYTVPAGQINTVFIFEAISTASGSISNGNFIDDINISIAVPATCSDDDNDGFPNNIDLDSDGDGCTDADEFYSDNNADGNDGGEFGSGTPVVDPANGTVIGASYTQVMTPEIVLENISETVGGVSINGQDVNLGDTFDYVLRFQNTGNDDATNYSIRNILPANVSLNSIDYGGLVGITDNHNPVTNVITFQIPDNLVEVGDPQNTIRIEVTVSGNCSDFVNACSNTLENIAFSTFESVTTNTVFSDEPNSANLPVCSPAPPVATNSLLNDLANCNIARTIQLCGADAILSAGTGFTTYNWAIDTNNNGQIDASEPIINDGDPDGDPSTLLITVTGNYIVEKSGATGCPDLIELITVELFGNTQTNPIIDFFNQVNSDANPSNDIQGDIVVCSIDGSELPQIFLCGENDDATIQLGITDALSIEWERLDETSCADVGDDCANTNNSCVWNNIGSGNNYTATDAGRYRVVINYLNGCFSRFHFNVFENTLNFTVPTPTDIICGTPGNITIAGLGSGFGYQLVDAASNTVVTPYSMNNGPSFDITSSGNYIVQITSLDPITNNPINGACVFETASIGILERNYQVNVNSTPADCSGFGEITVEALNVFPNYSYRLFLDDGTTLVEENLVTVDNNHTFTVAPGDYVAVTTTEDGCTNTQNIEVIQIPDLSLSASVTENITCNAGLVTLSPVGGDPSPDYRMAIWSINGVDQFTDIADALATATFQTTNDFFFSTSAEAGDYEFIVFDDNDCSALSNEVTVQDLGTVSISTTNTPIVCAGASTATLTVIATGGAAPYEYSIDGSTFQTTNTFPNLAGGDYTITVRDSSGSAVSRCTESINHQIDEPFRLNASAAIIEDIACDPSGTLVSILNPSGGQAPYEYSFDGGTTFGTANNRSLLAGNYQLVLRDALGCRFNIDITVPSAIADPTLTSAVDYDCSGDGTITIGTSNTVDFNYTYSLNGTLNTPANSNIFDNLSVGTHTVTVAYSPVLAPNQSTLFFEDFGAGDDTQIAEVGTLYCFEPQDGTIVSCNKGPAGIFVNGEYTVTNLITNTNPFIRSPQDHTGLTDGRFFAIDISTFSTSGVPQPNNILWARPNLEVLPNEDVTLNFWAYNLITDAQTDPNVTNPEVLIEILDNTGTVIHTQVAPEIPKNTNDNDWHQRTITFNPGTNTDIDIVFRTNRNSDLGNDLVVDDISVSQLPEACERTQDISVIVAADNAFEAALLNEIDPSCNGASDGAFRFEVDNFDSATGFEYSVDGGTTWIAETTSPFTTPTSLNLTDGNYTIAVRRANEPTCVVSFTANLTEPTVIVPDLQLTAEFTCFNTGATLLASATGGTPGYQYQLEDTSGGIITAYQTNASFLNVAAGDYLVRVRDNNNCDVLLPIADAVTVEAPETIVFNTNPTACYSGANNGSITVNVTAGNGNYEFRIDGGVWVAPTPANATSHTFNGLSEGSYNIEVRDQLGCPNTANTQTVVIADQLIVDVNIVDLSSCADGSITINATGGNGTLEYAIVPANTSPTGSFTTTNTLTISAAMATANPAGYDVHVQDNSGGTPLCTFIQEDIIFTPVTPLSINAVTEDPLCFNGLGEIDITITGGNGPYTYTVVDLSPADGIDYGRNDSNISTTTLTYSGIGVGTYEVSVTDINTCTVTPSIVTISNAIEITADITPILPANCTSTIESDFGFEFINITSPTGTPGTIEYSNDGGTTWQSSTELRGTVANPTFSGTAVFPSIRVEVAPGVFCQRDFPRYIIPFPLDDLDITLSAIIVGCNDLQVTVQGSQGDSSTGYDYTYTDDPANFTTFISDPNVWVENIPLGTSHTFQNIDPVTPQFPEVPLLVPGRTYVFYVRDGAGCIRQSNVNVNEIPGIGLPIDITTDVTPSCDGAANGSITFNLNPDMAFPNMRWEIFELGNSTPIETSGGNVPFSTTVTTTTPLTEGEYFINVIQVDGSNVDACSGASENVFVPELAPLNATAVVTRDISCNLPGLISINGITGGGGAPYTYDVVGPAGFTAISGSADNPVQIPVNSPAGSYTVTLHDQFDCPLPLNAVTLNLAPNPTISVSQDNCESPITVTAVGTSSAGNFRYAMVTNGSPAPLSFIDNAGEFDNVTPGSYDVYVIDANGCMAVQTNFIVNPVLSANASLTKLIDCTVSPDAVINIEVLDGSGNYEYTITNTVGAPSITTPTVIPSTNFDYLTSIAGDYTITIFDTTTPNNATCNREFIVNVPDRIEPIIDSNIQVTQISCMGANDASITITTTNANAAPYTFEITLLDGAAVSIVPTSTTANSATFTGLAPAAISGYVVTVRGNLTSNNCSVDSSPIIITEPTAISVPVPTVVQFGCSTGNSSENASIEITGVTGGSSNFVRYEFIKEDDPNTVAIEPATVVQNGTSTTYIETNNTGGVYTINVYDDKNCIGTTSAIITALDELQSAFINIVDPISCTSSGEDITIDVTSSITDFSSDPTNYEFRLLPSVTYEAPGDNTFNDLTSGTHTFGVRNIATGCEIFIDHSIEDPNTFDVIVTKLNDAVCFGDDGTIELTFIDTSFAGGFTYSIFNTNGTPSDRTDDGAAILTGVSASVGVTPTIDVPAGDYLVEVIQDAFPECSQIRSFTITTPSAPITLGTINLSSVSCSNNEGTAQIIPTGGVAPYDITLTAIVNSTSTVVSAVSGHLFNNLGEGSYTVSITDANGCTELFTNAFSLIEPEAISGVINPVGIECFGDTDGSVTFNLSARNTTPDIPNYNYSLNTYSDITGTTLLRNSALQTSSSFNNLGAGFYSISVTDDLGCDFESTIVEIVAPIPVNALLVTANPISCTTGADISLRASGGTGPYEWSEDGTNYFNFNNLDGADTHLFENEPAGTYSYFIRDSFNCLSIVSNTVTINPIDPLTITLDTTAAIVSCSGESTALIIAHANGGLGEYEYALATDVTFIATSIIRPNQDNGNFANLPAGNYYVRVQSRDCQDVTTVITIDEPAPLIVDPIISEISCFDATDGSITINTSGGAGNYIYAISPNLNQFDDANVFDELGPGNYTVIVQDGNGCFEVIDFTLDRPDELIATATSTDEICFESEDGSIALNVLGGTAPYFTALNSNNDADFTQDELTYTDLPGGTHVVFVRDANNCETNVIVEINSGVNLTAEPVIEYICPATITSNTVSLSFEDQTVLNDLLYGLDTTDSSQLGLSATFNNLSPGDHFIYVLHSNGCDRTINFTIDEFAPLDLQVTESDINTISAFATGGSENYTYTINGENATSNGEFHITATDTYIITVTDENGCNLSRSIFIEFIEVEIPTFFTPDGDGLNDTWAPRNISQFDNIFIKIYDRYGRSLYVFKGNTDSWDGQYQLENLPSGDYWYVIKLNGIEDQRELVGHFTLYR